MKALGRSILWLAIGLTLGGLAGARELTPAESAVLQARHAGRQQFTDAQRLVETLGAEADLDIVPVLLELKDDTLDQTLISSFFRGFSRTPRGQAPEPSLEVLAIAMVQEPDFLTQRWPAPSSRQMFLHAITRHPSRGAWQTYYGVIQGAYKRSAQALADGPAAGDMAVRWERTVVLTAPDLPGTEEPIAALLPLMRDGCQGGPLIQFIGQRRYAPAFPRLRDLYVRSNARTYACGEAITTALEELQLKDATESIAVQLRLLAAQAAVDQPRIEADKAAIRGMVGRSMDAAANARVASLQQEIADIERHGANDVWIDRMLTGFGATIAEAQIDYEALAADVLGKLGRSAQRAKLEQDFGRVIDHARRAREYTLPNLFYWIDDRRPRIVESFVRHHVNTAGVDGLGLTPLCDAIYRGEIETVRVLLDGGVDANPQPQLGGRKCMPLTMSTRTEVAELLSAHGARVNELDYSGMAPMHTFARAGNIPMMEWLLAHGALVNVPASRNNNVADAIFDRATPLHTAVQNSAPLESVRFLLDHHADVNARTAGGITPLLIAVANRERAFDMQHRAQPDDPGEAVVRELIDHGADVSIGADVKHEEHAWYLATPVILAHEAGDTETEQLLKSRGALVNPVALATRRALLETRRLLSVPQPH